MLGLIGLIVVNQSSLQWKITMQEGHLCWPPYFFPRPRSASTFFHSRIATVTPVSHSLTRPIHNCPSCWTIYLSFEIILEMITVHWIELQIQCFIQIHCFKNIQSDMNYVSKNTFKMAFLMVWRELFLHTSIWVSEEGKEFENLLFS